MNWFFIFDFEGNIFFESERNFLSICLRSVFVNFKKSWVKFFIIIGVHGQVIAAPVATPPTNASRTVMYGYHPANGFLSTVVAEPDNVQLRLENNIQYDSWGNESMTTISSPAIGDAAFETRKSHVLFDSRGQFAYEFSNFLSQSQKVTYDLKFGLVGAVTDLNGLAREFRYDSLGRKILAIGTDGNRIKWDYYFCNGVNGGMLACPMYASYVIQSTPMAADGVTVNGAWSKIYFDELDREVATETAGFDGSIIIVNTEYDNRGRISRVSRPYYQGEKIYWNITSYDDIGRVSISVAANGAETIHSYNGLNKKLKNSAGQVRIIENDINGKISKIIDNSGGEISYDYDNFGNLWKTTDSKNNAIKIAYDVLGRKVAMEDPDMGESTYVNNALGELVLQVDAKGQVSRFSYDKLGRLISRRENDMISSWDYDNCVKGIGKICKISADNGYREIFGYDDFGRANTGIEIIDTEYMASINFDANGRLATKTFPAGLKLRYEYTQTGYLKSILDNDSNALYWAAQKMDAEGHLQTQVYGNNVVTTSEFDNASGRIRKIYSGAEKGVQNLEYDFDVIGNLRFRTDHTQGLTESFLYDGLNRLRSSTVNSGGAGLVTQSYEYDGIGNLESRSGIGKYIYDTAPKVSPHAVGTIQLSDGGIRRFEYDLNGNLTKDFKKDASGRAIAGTERTIDYTSFNMPLRISSAGKNLNFLYDSSYKRIKEISPDATTFYVHPDGSGGLYYEKEVRADGSIEHRQFIMADGDVVAVVKQGSAGKSIQYFHRDHIGSTVAVSDQNGTIIERLAYEPFGKRRYTSGVQDVNGLIKGANSDRGFTNHQHLDELGLIHMNGRVYDPVISRFISADPNIPDPYDIQSFNRYSYVRGNPLAFTDPSGFSDVNPFDIVVEINGSRLGHGFLATANAVYVMSLDGFEWKMMGWSASASDGTIVAGTHGRKLPANSANTNRNYIVREAMLSSPNRFVAEGTACVGHEGTCVAVGTALLGGGGLASTKLGRAALALLEFGTTVQSMADGVPAGRGIAAAEAKAATVALSKVDAVIAETLAGKGNITSKLKLTSDELLTAGQKFLGTGYTEIGKPGSGVFRSADGLRNFRIDANSIMGNHAPGVPHGHLEVYVPGATKPLTNNHIPFTP